MTLFLWLIQQDDRNGYDTYDSAVVAATTEEEARSVYPGGTEPRDSESYWRAELQGRGSQCWAKSPISVTATRIGTADDHLKPGDVVCASFNAG